ncbi:MAG: cytochrome c biogenesis protein CcsA [Gemmatimonadales bacterium]|jgi:heme exporter protein C|nr:cytochrome c biogenesis protein CcsA [Gemmatimonadales bacterium]
MSGNGLRKGGVALTVLGLIGLLAVYWLAFFWVSTEIRQGVAQRIFYVHVPAAWTAFLAFGIAALTSAMYLWLRDERLDRAAVSAAEGGMVFGTIMLITGPLWGKIAWGTYWNWEPRLTLTLLLWFIFLGYFMVRSATDNPEKGKRFAAVVAIVGALDIPFIHLSVVWFRSLHPEPVVLKPEGPSLPGDMLILLLASVAVFQILFFGLFLFRYSIENVRGEVESRAREATVA